MPSTTEKNNLGGGAESSVGACGAYSCRRGVAIEPSPPHITITLPQGSQTLVVCTCQRTPSLCRTWSPQPIDAPIAVWSAGRVCWRKLGGYASTCTPEMVQHYLPSVRGRCVWRGCVERDENTAPLITSHHTQSHHIQNAQLYSCAYGSCDSFGYSLVQRQREYKHMKLLECVHVMLYIHMCVLSYWYKSLLHHTDYVVRTFS